VCIKPAIKRYELRCHISRKNKVKEFNERKFKLESERIQTRGNQGTALTTTLYRFICNVIWYQGPRTFVLVTQSFETKISFDLMAALQRGPVQFS